MAITFIRQRKKQKYLLLALVVILIVVIIVIWEGFFREKEGVLPVEGLPHKKVITINFDILENPVLKQLQPFEEIQLLPVEIPRRDNPFLPYKGTKEVIPLLPE